MTISGFTPTALPAQTMLANSNPLLARTSQVPVSQPGIGSRLVSAMRAAISELRGQGATDAQIQGQMLAMQAQVPVSPVHARAATTRPVTLTSSHKGKSFTDGAGNVREVGTGKILKAVAPKAAVAAPVASSPVVGGTQLPANATTLPGGTVYSYDGNGNPAVAGLAGMAPTMQQQLGINPTMLQGLTGMAQAVDPDGPQVNATNQTSLGIGSGIGGLGAGSAVPVLGAPILTTPAATATATGDTPRATGSTGGTQAVTNRNTTDVANHNEGFGGYGGYGGSSWGDPMGGVATPYSPYGSSMTGAYTIGTTPHRGFLSRLFGS